MPANTINTYLEKVARSIFNGVQYCFMEILSYSNIQCQANPHLWESSYQLLKEETLTSILLLNHDGPDQQEIRL
jgi:hypothetical protein